MEKIKLGKSGLMVPPLLSAACVFRAQERKQADTFLHTALELGLNFFDHADIYGGGEAERFFAQALPMTPSLREKVLIQSKCSILPGRGL